MKPTFSYCFLYVYQTVTLCKLENPPMIRRALGCPRLLGHGSFTLEDLNQDTSRRKRRAKKTFLEYKMGPPNKSNNS